MGYQQHPQVGGRGVLKFQGWGAPHWGPFSHHAPPQPCRDPIHKTLGAQMPSAPPLGFQREHPSWKQDPGESGRPPRTRSAPPHPHPHPVEWQSQLGVRAGHHHPCPQTGCSVECALEAASLHPAQLLGLEKRKGTLDFGADAGQGATGSGPGVPRRPGPGPGWGQVGWRQVLPHS